MVTTTWIGSSIRETSGWGGWCEFRFNAIVIAPSNTRVTHTAIVIHTAGKMSPPKKKFGCCLGRFCL